MPQIKVELTWTMDGQAHSHSVEAEVKASEGPMEVLRRATKEAVEAVEAKTVNW